MTDLGTDILLERRHEFAVHGKRFMLVPPSLGVTLMIKGALDALKVDMSLFEQNPVLALMPIVAKRPLDCCRFIAYGTCATREEAMSGKDIDRKAAHFRKWLSPEEIISLVLIVLGSNKVAQFLQDSGIEKEAERLRKVSAYKKNDVPTFGGKTLFGQLVDPAIERYGWTYEYAVWGISYAALTALMADKVTSLVLTDEERKKVPKRLLNNEGAISGDDPRNWAKIKEIMNMS